jgi:hypothetical protein
MRVGNEDWNTCCTILPCDRALAAVLSNAGRRPPVRMSMACHRQERQPVQASSHAPLRSPDFATRRLRFGRAGHSRSRFECAAAKYSRAAARFGHASLGFGKSGVGGDRGERRDEREERRGTAPDRPLGMGSQIAARIGLLFGWAFAAVLGHAWGTKRAFGHGPRHGLVALGPKLQIRSYCIRFSQPGDEMIYKYSNHELSSSFQKNTQFMLLITMW